MRWSKKNNMIRMKSTTISCLYSILYKSLGWLPLTTVTNQRNIHHFPRFLGEDQYIVYASNICKMCPENITIPGACRELMPFFFNEIYFPMEAGWIRPTNAGVHPPQIHKKKHGHKCNGMCVCVPLFIRSTHSFQLYVWTPRWWYTVSQMMIFFKHQPCPF